MYESDVVLFGFTLTLLGISLAGGLWILVAVFAVILLLLAIRVIRRVLR